MKNLNVEYKRKLPTAEEIKKEIPVTDKIKKIKDIRDKEISEIFRGENNRLILIVGPCSADREDAVIDYIKRLIPIQEKVKDKIIIIPRIYTSKPRTTGEGYKGMLHQPDAHNAPNILEGVKAVRRLHKRAIEETGFCCADEMLYPENYKYLSDLLSYVAVGARSVENQEHRLVSSGMNIPVGMKNPTSGDVSVMLNSVKAAQINHMFLYDGWEVETKGNEMAHAILRGRVDNKGISYPNYHYEDLKELYNEYYNEKFINPSVIIDANHANSGKKYLEQPRIVKEVLQVMNRSNEIKNMVKGFMIESYIEDGCQSMNERIYGKSITDPCLGIEKTKQLILEIADII